MTDKAQAKLNELEAQKSLVEITDDYIERLQRDLESAKSHYELIYEEDENGERIKDEDGKDKYRWEDVPYTDEELEEIPSVKGRIKAYETIIKALEKLM